MTLQNYLKNNKKTHLIFDFDETLVKLELPWEIWGKKLTDIIVKYDPKVLKKLVSGELDLVEILNEMIRINRESLKNQIVKNQVDFEAEVKSVAPNHELLEFIKDANSYQMFVWSSNTKPTVHKALEGHKVKNRFKKIVTRSDLNYLKPHPEGFDFIHDGKTSLANYLFVGDSKYDKQVAEKIGIDFFQVNFFKYFT